MPLTTTIRLSRPLQGSDVIERVRQTVSLCQAAYEKRSFIAAKDPQASDWTLIGQASDRGCDHIQVHSCSDKSQGIHPAHTYDQIVVRSQAWPGWGHLMSGHTERLNSLREFADTLEQLLISP